MNIKEENEKLVKENEELTIENKRLIQSNTDVVSSINASKLAAEEAARKELEGKQILTLLSKEVEDMVAYSQSARSEFSAINNDIDKARLEKSNVETETIALKKEALADFELTKSEYQSELEKMNANIQVKKNELTDLLSKIKEESFNLVSIKSNVSAASIELKEKQSKLEALTTQCIIKDGDLDILNAEYEQLKSNVKEANQVLKDTKISTESHEEQKSKLILEINTLNEEINTAKTTIVSTNAEITDLQIKKEEKEAEYTGSVSKIFDLLRREEALLEREEYAKSRFKDAGLEY